MLSLSGAAGGHWENIRRAPSPLTPKMIQNITNMKLKLLDLIKKVFHNFIERSLMFRQITVIKEIKLETREEMLNQVMSI